MTPSERISPHDLDVAEKLGKVLHAIDRVQVHIEGLSTRLVNVEDIVKPLMKLVPDIAKLQEEFVKAKIKHSRLQWVWFGGATVLAALSGGLTIWLTLTR